MAQIADRVGKLPGKSKDRFLQVVTSGVVRSTLRARRLNSLEGLTWPDTYLIGANETEDQILYKIVVEFDKRADAAGLADRAEPGGALARTRCWSRRRSSRPSRGATPTRRSSPQ